MRRTLVYVVGGPEYRKRCEEVASNDYEGFELQKRAIAHGFECDILITGKPGASPEILVGGL